MSDLWGYNKVMLDLFFLYCQFIENMYMDWKAFMVKELSRNQVDEHLPF